MSEVFAIAALAVLLPAITSWRAALLMTLCTGFLQDVLRKLTPGEPVYMVMLFAPVFALAAIGLMLSGGTIGLRPMFGLHPSLRAPVTVFLLVVAGQVLVTMASTGNMVLAGLGTMAYVLPFVALTVAMYFAGSLDAMVSAMRVYVLMSALFCIGVYLNVLGYQDGILDSVGAGLFIYPPEGGVVKLPSGLFRSPEIAAWHGATAAALTALLILVRRFPGGHVAGVLVLSVLVGAVLLTGRRKMIVELVLFASVFVTMLAFYRERSARVVMLLGTLAACILLVQLVFVPEQGAANVRPYLSRYDTVAQEAADRLQRMTVDSFQWVIYHNGLLGSGAGTAAQGARFFGGGTRLVGLATEGGLAKVLAELGVHGLAAAIWVSIALGFACHASLRRLHAGGHRLRATVATGLCAMLFANLLVFATASQVFGDPFVLTVLGLVLGFVLRVPEAAAATRAVSREATA